MTAWRNPSTRTARAAGMTTTVLAGAVAMVIATPQVTSDAPIAVRLTATESSFQPALDSLLQVMQEAAAQDAAQPFAPPGSEETLMTMLQNTNYELLMAGISRVTELFNGWFFQSPEVVAGDAADSRQYFQFFTPDIYYHVTAGLAPGATYQLSGTLGGGTEALAIATEKINGATAITKSSLELDHGLVVNPNGTFDVYVGPSEPSGAVNFLNDTDATASGDASLLIRDMLGNWADGPASISIHCVSDCPPFAAIPSGGLLPTPGADAPGVDAAATTLAGSDTGSPDSLLNTLFSAFATIVPTFNDMNIGLAKIAGISLPANTMGALQSETSLFATGLPSAAVSAGNFDLDPGQALIVKVPDVQAGYSGIELMNAFGGGLPATLAQTTLNNTTAFHDPDGFTYYVVSATNPGVANWLDSGDVTNGEIFARFESLPDGVNPVGEAVTTQVVPVADVSKYLPADTPTVSASEYAADMAQRVFSYDYGLDLSRMNAQPDWLIQQVLLQGLQGLVGEKDFNAVFGSEPSTPLDVRMDPALTPDWDAVMNDLSTHPTTSLTAIFHALPLLSSDINLPIQLAMVDSVLALLLPNGSQLLSEAFTDPNSGIMAGLLNARDDLATAVLNANGDFPTELGAEATQQWANISDLVGSS